MPRRPESSWAEWGPPPGEYRQNPPQTDQVTLYRRDRNGFVWLRRVMLDDWVTISEAANILKVDPATAWKWSQEGGPLPVTIRKNLRLIRFREVLKLAEERGTAPPPPKGQVPGEDGGLQETPHRHRRPMKA